MTKIWVLLKTNCFHGISISCFQGECSRRLLQTKLVRSAFVAEEIGGAAPGTPIRAFTFAEHRQGELRHRLSASVPQLPHLEKHLHLHLFRRAVNKCIENIVVLPPSSSLLPLRLADSEEVKISI